MKSYLLGRYMYMNTPVSITLTLIAKIPSYLDNTKSHIISYSLEKKKIFNHTSVALDFNIDNNTASI